MTQQITAKDIVQSVLGFGAFLAIFHYVFPMIPGIAVTGSWLALGSMVCVQFAIIAVAATIMAIALYNTGLIPSVESAKSSKTQAILFVPSTLVTAFSLLCLSWIFPGSLQVAGWIPAIEASLVWSVFGFVWQFAWSRTN